MPINEQWDGKSAFKLGFRCKCAECGLSDADALALAQRGLAGFRVLRDGDKSASIVGDIMSAGQLGTGLALAGAAAAPLAIGAIGGAGLASLRGVADPDDSELKREERIAALQRAAARLRSTTRLRRLKLRTQPSRISGPRL